MQPFVGSLIMVIIVILTMMLNVDKVVGVIGSITPFLFVLIVIISIYSVFTMDLSFFSLNPMAKSQESTFPNWFISAINYVSFNIAVGGGFAIVMGGVYVDYYVAGTCVVVIGR